MVHLPLRQEMLHHIYREQFGHRRPDVWSYFLARINQPPMKAVARRALILDRVDLRPLLSEICQPILLVCGARDALVGRDCEDVLLQSLPHAIRAEIEACGHFPYFTHPEVLAEVVFRFLTPLPCA
jgi:pimeloyl-ACP methyl ester carboxylesterase